MQNKKGFTLIELLVVVLIIGILAAIALPQYKYVVAKSKFVQLKTAIKAMRDAEERYMLTHNEPTLDLKALDIEIQGGNYSTTWIAENDTITFDWGGCTLGGSPNWQILYCYINNPYIIYHANFESNIKHCCASLESGEIGKRLCQEEFPGAVGIQLDNWCGAGGTRYDGY